MNAKPRHGMTEQAADAAVEQACRMLRLPTIRTQFPDLAQAAAREQMSYRAFLAELLMAECDDRARRRSERRIKAAGFPREKSLRTFDFDANPNLDPAVIHTLATCDWVKKGLPLCLIGDSGTGKSHLLIALGTEAAMAGFRVRYTLATKLVNELVEAADDRQLTKTINRYGRVDLLCLDELGYMELDRRGAELLFQVLTEREETASVAIASNESFSKAHLFARTCAGQRCNLTRPVGLIWGAPPAAAAGAVWWAGVMSGAAGRRDLRRPAGVSGWSSRCPRRGRSSARRGCCIAATRVWPGLYSGCAGRPGAGRWE
jgi:DNA replication protein DnaC